MSLLFVDLETGGLPIQDSYHKYYSYKKLEKYDSSRIVQFSFIRYKRDESMISINDHIIKPLDFIISQESIDIHHIDQDKALKEGEDLSEIMDIFEEELDKSKVMVMHNVKFDRNVLLSEAYRMGRFGLVDKIYNHKHYCTMRTTKDLCKLPSLYYDGYKLPTLTELHNHLFTERLNPNIMHNSLNDVKITAKCFFRLLKKGLIK